MTQTIGRAPTPSTQHPCELSWATMDSPVGVLLLARSAEGLIRLAFECEGTDAVLAQLARGTGAQPRQDPVRLSAARTELDEYFAGTRRAFDIALDRSLSSGFRARVQLAMSTIGYGQTLTYKGLAELAGSPRAVRAVGSACATNPLPIVVPCHRVLRSDGGLGGYAGGLDVKRTLLGLEARVAAGDPAPTRR